MGVYAFGIRFQSFWSRSFARKDLSREKRNAEQNCFQTVTHVFVELDFRVGLRIFKIGVTDMLV